MRVDGAPLGGVIRSVMRYAAPLSTAWEAAVPVRRGRRQRSRRCCAERRGGECSPAPGSSTDSGIPDYRGSTGRLRRHTPMTYDAFARRPARPAPLLGPQPRRLAADRAAPGPNAGHRRRRPRCSAAGPARRGDHAERRRAAPAGGRARRRRAARRRWTATVCLGCGRRAPHRAALDERSPRGEPDVRPARPTEINPDGDAELPDEVLDGFVDGRLPRLRRRAAQAGRRLLRRDRARAASGRRSTCRRHHRAPPRAGGSASIRRS